MEFSQRLMKWRAREGVSRAQLGKRIGVRYSAVANWENGYRKPNIEALLKLELLTHGEIQAREYAPNAFKIHAP